MKSARKSISTKQKIVYALVSLLVLAVGYIAYLHITDYMKFMTLRSDMKQLQAEFNKIDAGWEYTEYCKAKGEKFKENEASSCYVSIMNPNDINMDYTPQINSNRLFSKITEFTLDNEAGLEMLYSKNDSVVCSYWKDINNKSIQLQCHDSARNFYFSRLP